MLEKIVSYVDTAAPSEAFLVHEDPEDYEEDDEPVPDWDQEEFELIFAEYRARNRNYYDRQILAVADCPQFRIRRASRVATRLFDQILRERMRDVGRPDYILRSTQIPVLCAIMIAAGRQSMQEIARDLFMDPSTLSRAVDVLEDRGYVARTVARNDRRRRTVRLTPVGLDVLRRNTAWWRICQQTLADRFPPEPPRERGRRQRLAIEGVDLVFHMARRCMFDRGYRWEMRDPPNLRI